MAVAEEVSSRPQDPKGKRKPFATWMKKIANLKGGDQQGSGGKKKLSAKHKKNNTHNGAINNNPYPESGPLRQRQHSLSSSTNGRLFLAPPTSRPRDEDASYASIPPNSLEEREEKGHSNKSGAPTLATNPDTVHSDAAHSKAATTITGGGALSSADGTGAGSTFSSPNQSERSLTTTLTTIQSQAPAHALQNVQNGASGHNNLHHHGMLNNPNPAVTFSQPFPIAPAPSGMTASAIPRHLQEGIPNTYNSATANNMLSDNASILTLASSGKRRRRSMDTDASVRALAPSSVWGGSHESLPLSVLSGTADAASTGPGGLYTAFQSRPSIGGLASAERASVYSSQGVSAPALASERNSCYSRNRDPGDAKSLRSVTGIAPSSMYDARSINEARSQNADARSQFDGRSTFDARSQFDAKSLGGDVASVKGYEGSVRSGAAGHARTDSIPGSIGSPLASPGLRQ